MYRIDDYGLLIILHVSKILLQYQECSTCFIVHYAIQTILSVYHQFIWIQIAPRFYLLDSNKSLSSPIFSWTTSAFYISAEHSSSTC
ncbi:hypothetical protein BDR03DRAFT_961082 [Suillus americanus]|nr:hypothetical protein BDR03DRAFT_961082 [Suillus americanus]